MGAQPHLARLRLHFLLSAIDACRLGGAAASGRLSPPASCELLDLGCGEGWFAAEAASAGAEVLAADVGREPLRRAALLHPHLRLVQIDPCAPLPFEDASFHIVWASEVIEHVPDTASWLSEVRRVLRPSGKLLITTPAHEPLALLRGALMPSAFAREFDPRSDHLRFYNRRSLRALLAEFRFTEVSISTACGLWGARAIMLASARRQRF